MEMKPARWWRALHT